MKVRLEREGRDPMDFTLDDKYMQAVGVEVLTVEDFEGFYLFTGVEDDGTRILTWKADDIYKYMEKIIREGSYDGG